jgi:8-oxo-dGTP pyrophosphatase MutT (NUDIX family)
MHSQHQVEVILWRKASPTVEFLLVQKPVEAGGYWESLTGTLNQDETPEVAAERLILEKLGSSPLSDPKVLDFHFYTLDKSGKPIQNEVVTAEIHPSVKIAVSPDYIGFSWHSQEEAEAQLLWEDNREALRRTALHQRTSSKPFTRIPAVAAIVERNKHCLIIQRGANDFLPNTWELPGGAIEEGEDLVAAVQREIAEETGLTDVVIHEPINTNAYVLELSDKIKEVAHTTLTATLNSKQPVILSGEHQAFAWISKEEFYSYDFSRHNRESLMKHFGII